jgi:hypothetical protein
MRTFTVIALVGRVGVLAGCCRPWLSQGASAFGRKFNRLPTEFPSRLSRENLRAIREPEAGNREPYPNDPWNQRSPDHLALELGEGEQFLEQMASDPTPKRILPRTRPRWRNWGAKSTMAGDAPKGALRTPDASGASIQAARSDWQRASPSTSNRIGSARLELRYKGARSLAD